MLEEASLEGQDTDSSRHCFVESSVCGQTMITRTVKLGAPREIPRRTSSYEQV